MINENAHTDIMDLAYGRLRIPEPEAAYTLRKDFGMWPQGSVIYVWPSQCVTDTFILKWPDGIRGVVTGNFVREYLFKSESTIVDSEYQGDHPL